MTDSTPLKRIMAVSPDSHLLQSRVLLLKSQGYEVEPVLNDDDAMSLLINTDFDLVLLGEEDSRHFGEQLDERFRRKYPKMLLLKIQSTNHDLSVYASRMVDAEPQHVIAVLKEMFSRG